MESHKPAIKLADFLVQFFNSVFFKSFITSRLISKLSYRYVVALIEEKKCVKPFKMTAYDFLQAVKIEELSCYLSLYPPRWVGLFARVSGCGHKAAWHKAVGLWA